MRYVAVSTHFTVFLFTQVLKFVFKTQKIILLISACDS